MGEHVPVPWDVLGPVRKQADDEPFFVVYAGDTEIVRLWSEAKAHFIARAVNSHEELLEATESLLELLCALIREEVWEVDSEYPEDYERLNTARAAIAKASGEES